MQLVFFWNYFDSFSFLLTPPLIGERYSRGAKTDAQIARMIRARPFIIAPKVSMSQFCIRKS
jgi:hypothetical protein